MLEKHPRVSLTLWHSLLLYSLLNGNLPVQFLGDRGPDDLTGVKPLVHTAQDELSAVQTGWLAEKECHKHEFPLHRWVRRSCLFSPLSPPSLPPSHTGVRQNEGVLFRLHLAQVQGKGEFSERHPVILRNNYQRIGNTDHVHKEDELVNQAPEKKLSQTPCLGQSKKPL